MRNCTNELRKAATSEAATSAFDFTMQRTDRTLKANRAQSRGQGRKGASIGGSSDTTPESSNPSISEPAALFDWANSGRSLRWVGGEEAVRGGGGVEYHLCSSRVYSQHCILSSVPLTLAASTLVEPPPDTHCPAYAHARVA